EPVVPQYRSHQFVVERCPGQRGADQRPVPALLFDQRVRVVDALVAGDQPREGITAPRLIAQDEPRYALREEPTPPCCRTHVPPPRSAVMGTTVRVGRALRNGPRTDRRLLPR